MQYAIHTGGVRGRAGFGVVVAAALCILHAGVVAQPVTPWKVEVSATSSGERVDVSALAARIGDMERAARTQAHWNPQADPLFAAAEKATASVLRLDRLNLTARSTGRDSKGADEMTVHWNVSHGPYSGDLVLRAPCPSRFTRYA